MPAPHKRPGSGAGRGVASCAMPPPRPAGPAPDRARLHDAALRHLARYAATEAGLVRVLDRRIDRWARAAATEGAVPEFAVPDARRAARAVAAALVQSGVINDQLFAESRARSLTRAGRSRRAVEAHLAHRGVGRTLAAQPEDPERELAAALIYARRRRLGPFRMGDGDPKREMGAMARAGFSQDVVRRALDLDPDEALSRVIALKQG